MDIKELNAMDCDEENVPLPVEKTKRIIRKCTDEDLAPHTMTK